MKYLLQIVIFVSLLTSSMFAQISIDFTNPDSGATFKEDSVIAIKATLTKEDTLKEWEYIKYSYDDASYTDYAFEEKSANEIIFDFSDTLKDDQKYTFYLKASLKDASFVQKDSIDFTVSTRPFIEASSSLAYDEKVSPRYPSLSINLNLNKKVDTTAIKPKFTFKQGGNKIHSIEDAGTWKSQMSFSLQTKELSEIGDKQGLVTIEVKDVFSQYGTKMKPTELDDIFEIETTLPVVTTVDYEPDRKIHIEDSSEITLKITFNEKMNVSINPNVSIFDENNETIFSTAGSWESDSTTYTVKNDSTIGQQYENGFKARVRIANAKDAFANEMETDDSKTAFTFDHQKPNVTNIKSSHKAIHIIEANKVELEIKFNEAMNTDKVPNVNVFNDTNKIAFNGEWQNTTLVVKNATRIDKNFATHNQKIDSIKINNAFDIAGNRLIASQKFELFTMDHRPPELKNVTSSREFANGETIQNVILKLSFNELIDPTDQNNIEVLVQDSVSITIENVEDVITSNPRYRITQTINTDTIQDGLLSFKFKGFKDTLNNRKSNFYSPKAVLTVDTQKPAIPAVNPFARSTNKNTFTFSGTKQDNNNHVGILINGEEKIAKTNEGTSWNYEYDVSGLSDSNKVEGVKYNFTFKAIDAAGNISVSSLNRVLWVDRTPPASVQLTTNPFDAEYINQSTVTFGIRNNSGEIAKFHFKESGVNREEPIYEGKRIQKGQTIPSLIKSFQEEVDGNRTLKIFAEDTLGNKTLSALKSYNFIVDRVEPKLKQIYVNGEATTNNDWEYIGPSGRDDLKIKCIFVEEVAGIDTTVQPKIQLLHKNGYSIALKDSGEWKGKYYTISNEERIPEDFSNDGIYYVHIKGVTDFAKNITALDTSFFIEVDTHAPQTPSISSLDSYEIISNVNTQNLQGLKDSTEATRILVEDADKREIIDSTSYTQKTSWNLDLLFTESREYIFEIYTQDLAKNNSNRIGLTMLIDWLPPVLSEVQPFMDIEYKGNIEVGYLHLFFNEDLHSPSIADSLYVWAREEGLSNPIQATDLSINKNEVRGEFDSQTLSELARWHNRGLTPVLNIEKQSVFDIAGNGNLAIGNVTFQIISPSIIDTVSSKNLYFSPNDDGVNDWLSFDITFEKKTEEKYLNLSVYDPETQGTILSIRNKHIDFSELPFMANDSTYKIIENTEKPKTITYIWFGKDAITKLPLPEGDYLVKVSGTSNKDFAHQFPTVLPANLDLTAPLIDRIEPVFGNNVLRLQDSSKINLYPNESIFFHDEKGKLKQKLFAYVDLFIIQDTSNVNGSAGPFIQDTTEYEMETLIPDDSTYQDLKFTFEVVDSKISKFKGRPVSMYIRLKDLSQMEDTLFVEHVRFDSTTNNKIEELVNFPNPFNPEIESTHFQFSMGSKMANGMLRIFDVSGRLVAQKSFQKQSPGNYTLIEWDGNNLAGKTLANGVYYAIITNGDKKSNINKVLIYKNK